MKMSKVTIQGCEEILTHASSVDLRPPRTPYFNFMDFFALGVAKRDINGLPYVKKESFITFTKEILANFSRDDVNMTCTRVRSSLEEIRRANGNLIK